MAKAEFLSTDWERSAGDFSCTVCNRKRLPATEFSKKQVEKALAAFKAIPDKDIRTGPEMIHRHFVSGICKRCVEEQEEQGRAELEAKREARAEAIEQAVIGEAQRVTVTFAERPFGMTASKERSDAYLVVKCGEGKPAAKGGVRPGWRVVEVAGTPCGVDSLEAVQAILKGVELPAAVVFETVPAGADFCTACQQVLAAPLFSRKMRTKPPEKRRCTSCVEAAEGEAEREKEEAAGEAAAAAGDDDRPKSKLSELQQLCADSAQEAQKVTGLRAVRGAGYGGRGRGRGRGGRG